MSEPLPYAIDDPRPIAAEAPYTFWLPSAEELAALESGDCVKLIFRGAHDDGKRSVERMWVTIDMASGERLAGRLDSTLHDIEGLRPGDRIVFRRHHVIHRIWGQARRAPPPSPVAGLIYLDRCLVDRCVVEAGVPVGYLYREEPEPRREGDAYRDSGWRIRGDQRRLGDAELDARGAIFVALGKVLNVDDSWLPLIDAPIGSAFLRDWESGTIVPVDAAASRPPQRNR